MEKNLNITGQTDWNDYLRCPCGAHAGTPCVRPVFDIDAGMNMHFPHPGRPRADQPHGTTLRDMADVLEAGPIRTNGSAECVKDCCADRTIPWPDALDPHGPNAAPRVVCPAWCTRHEHGMSTREPHTLELLNLAVLDQDLTTDVPLHLYVEQELEEDARPVVRLEIGHQLYQPTGVVLSRSDRSRLAANLWLANQLTQQ